VAVIGSIYALWKSSAERDKIREETTTILAKQASDLAKSLGEARVRAREARAELDKCDDNARLLIYQRNGMEDELNAQLKTVQELIYAVNLLTSQVVENGFIPVWPPIDDRLQPSLRAKFDNDEDE